MSSHGNTCDISGASNETTLSQGLARALKMTSYFEASSSSSSAPSESASSIFKRTFSVHSVASKSPSFARRMNTERFESSIKYRVIGLGSCGSVFEVPGTSLVLKKATDTHSLWNDFRLTNLVHNAFLDMQHILQTNFPDRTPPRTPMCREFMLPTSFQWWNQNLVRFPDEHKSTGSVFTAERILPLPQETREALIKMYFDPKSQQDAMKSPENAPCLVRLYLGENETEDEEGRYYESLRNFPLKLSMMETLGLKVDDLAAEMAIGLAVIHWAARLDGMDCEFVLGSAVTPGRERVRGFTAASEPQEVYELDFKTRSTNLWILDFDKSAPFKFDKQIIEQRLVPAFLGNDPYFPRPDVDPKLWNKFSDAYLKASQAILEDRRVRSAVLKLPQRFLDKVVAKIKATAGWDAERDIVFAE